MDEDPLGSWSTWLGDGAVAGALMPLAAFAGAVMCSVLLHTGGDTHRLWVPMGLTVLIGGSIGAVATPPLWWVATRGWRRSPLAVIALGPLVGAGAGLGLVYAVEWLITGRALDPPWWGAVMLAATGGMALGGPWIAYLAVRARGKRGAGVIAGAVVWAASAGFLLVAAIQLSP